MIRTEVIARFSSFSARFEGRIAWLYLDVRGLATTAIGCLVPDLSSMLSLPWLTASREHATDGEIVREWARVRGMLEGLPASRYLVPESLVLSERAIDALVLTRLRASAVLLARRWPEFVSWPWQAQMATLSIAWAVGAGDARPGILSPEWPRLQAALRAQDWDAAAAECAISDRGNAGVRPRNEANRLLLIEASGRGDT